MKIGKRITKNENNPLIFYNNQGQRELELVSDSRRTYFKNQGRFLWAWTSQQNFLILNEPLLFPSFFKKYTRHTLEVYTFHALLLVLHLRMTANFLL